MLFDIETKSSQKLRGGFYTPPLIASFLARWAIRQPADTILEPSCGDGVIAESAVHKLKALGATNKQIEGQLVAIELESSQALATAKRLSRQSVNPDDIVKRGDFFDIYHRKTFSSRTFKAVIGNPPFLRYHAFPEEQKLVAFRIMDSMGVKNNRLTNSWVAFIIASACKLDQDGRLAMVIPAELLQVNYAASTRAFLTSFFQHITIVCFKNLVFPEVQQEVVLVLAERTSNRPGLQLLEVTDANDLEDKIQSAPTKPLSLGEDKWTKYFLESPEIDLLEEIHQHQGLVPLHTYGETDVGLVTGNNKFFALRPSDVKRLRLHQFAEPLVGRTSQLVGLTYTSSDLSNDEDGDFTCKFLRIRDADTLDTSTKMYVRWGEENAMNTGYKCSIRRKWWVVPSVWTPDAFLFRQIHYYPKIVANLTNATSTDTVHRMRIRADVDPRELAATFLNSITFAFSEIKGRSYGGGVLELEPNEADILPLPILKTQTLDFEYLDRLERGRQIDKILDHTDEVLLRGQMGLSKSDCNKLRLVWKKLADRRINRKRTKK